MAIFEPIEILKIAEECGINEISNVCELKEEFERRLKTPKYVLGFLKYKNQIADINKAISMLSEKAQCGYRVIQKSNYYGKEADIILDNNNELNLFIQLNRISQVDTFSITDETRKSVIKEIMGLAEEKGMLIGYYFLIYLHYLEYIVLDSEQLKKVYSRVREIAATDFYLDKNYKKIAQHLDGIHGAYNNLCYYALRLPLFISICEYKMRDQDSSFRYLIRMLQVSSDYEIRYEEKLISLLEDSYIRYEIARRVAYGEGAERDVESASYMIESILDSCSYINEEEILKGYIFETPSKKQIQVKELKSLLFNLLDYTSRNKNDDGRASKTKAHTVEELFKRHDDKQLVETKNNKDWNRANELVKELDSMQGLNSVKRKVHELLDGIKVAEYKKEHFRDESDGFGTMHLIFTGNAGTGKTTVARILGKIYGALGILANEDLFIECGRADLVGEYVGHTAPKVKKMVEAALGGILFIDEAYALTTGNDVFGTEAVNTLLAEVENHRKELIVILAGYKDKMQEFLKSNQGLSSRFCTEIYFEDYSPKDMVEIIRKMGAERTEPMSFTPEVEEYLFELFKKKSLDKESDFGNARGVRNIFEAMLNQNSSRVAEMIQKGMEPTKDDIYIFQLEDAIRCSECGSLMNMRDGKYGKFMSCKNHKCKNTISVERYFTSAQNK